MNVIIAPFIALYTSVFLLMAGVGLLGTYLPLRLSVEGVATPFVGFIMSAYFFGMCIGALYCHRLIRSVGHIRAFAAFAATTTSVVILRPTATSSTACSRMAIPLQLVVWSAR